MSLRRRIARALREGGGAFFALADFVDSLPFWRAFLEACPQCWRTSDGGTCVACGLNTGALTGDGFPSCEACEDEGCARCDAEIEAVERRAAELRKAGHDPQSALLAAILESPKSPRTSGPGPIDIACPVRGCGAGPGERCTERGARRRVVHVSRSARWQGSRTVVELGDVLGDAWDSSGGTR